MHRQSKLQGQAGSQRQRHAQGSVLSVQTSEVTGVSFDTAAGELIPRRVSSGGSTSPGPGALSEGSATRLDGLPAAQGLALHNAFCNFHFIGVQS